MISEPMGLLKQTVHLPYTNTNTISKRIKMRFHMTPRHVGVLSGASKMISEPTIRLVQTVHLSCVKFSTISKWTKTRFHMTHIS
jgi:hypothetical protein